MSLERISTPVPIGSLQSEITDEGKIKVTDNGGYEKTYETQSKAQRGLRMRAQWERVRQAGSVVGAGIAGAAASIDVAVASAVPESKPVLAATTVIFLASAVAEGFSAVRHGRNSRTLERAATQLGPKPTRGNSTTPVYSAADQWNITQHYYTRGSSRIGRRT